MGKAALALLLLATPAWAQTQPCYPMLEVKQRLALTGQLLHSHGIEQTGVPTFLFRNPRTLEWTLILRPAPDFYCIVARGAGWKSLKTPGRKL